MQVNTNSLFQFGGLATGLDSRAIINALLQVQSIPILRLQSQKQTLGKQDGILANLDTRLDALRDKMEGLDTVAEAASFSASSSNEDVLAVSASGSAQGGLFQFTVDQLASAHSLRADGGFADRDTTVVANGGSIVIDFTDPGAQDSTIALSGPVTLDQLRHAINAADSGVTASIIDTGIGVTPHELVITSNETGATQAFTLDVSGLDQGHPSLAFTAAPLQVAQNSQITLGTGASQIVISRASNTVTDALEGVSLNLRQLGSAEVRVESNPGGVKAKIQEFVNAYNDVVQILSQQSVVDDEGKTTAVLFGDSALRSISLQLRKAIQNRATGLSGQYDSLAALGIRTGVDGKLSLDSGDLDDALANDFAGVVELLSDSASGVARKVKDAVDTLTNSADGIIKSRRDGIAARQKSIDGRIGKMEDRLDRFEQLLVDRYAALEVLVSNLQAQGASLNF